MPAASPNWTALEQADVRTVAGRASLRKEVVKPLILRDDYDKAAAVLEGILCESRERDDTLQLARLLRLSGDVESAVQLLREAREARPEDPKIARSYVKTSLRLQQPSRTADAARETRALWHADATLADAATRALYRDGDMNGALEAAQLSVALNPENPSALTFAAAVFNAAGRPSDAQQALLARPTEWKTAAPEHVFELARATFQLDPGSEDARALLGCVHSERPDNKRFADLYARCLYSQGDASQAVEIIERSRTMEGSAAGALLYARCLRQVKRYADAAEAVDQFLSQFEAGDSERRFAIGIYQLAGRQREAKQLAEGARAIVEARLPSTLHAALESIPDDLEAAGIPDARLNWSWSHVRTLKNAPKNRETWEDQVRWVSAADRSIREFLEYRPSEVPAIADLIDLEPSTREAVVAALSKGKGAIIALAHVGALFAGPVTLAKMQVPMSFVASTPDLNDGLIPAAPQARFISAASNDSLTVARQILRDLSDGRAVAIALDGAVFPGAPRYKLLDRTIALSDFVPRRAFKSGIPAFYGEIRWIDGRLRPKLVPLPDAEAARNEEEFVEMWMSAFIDQIEVLFAESPENLRMTGGFWNSIKC